MNQDLFYRLFEIDRSKVDKKTRTVPVSFSSEEPVRRWFGDEYLLHGDENVDLSQLRSTGAVLMEHNPHMILGPLTDVRIDNQRGKATVGFDDDEDGNKALNKVISGSLRGISVGARVLEFQRIFEDETYTMPDGRTIKGPAMIATKWKPHEVSLTAVPEDATVGIGRSITKSLDGITIHESKNTEDNEMDKKEITDLVRSLFAELKEGLNAPTADELVTSVLEKIDERSIVNFQVDATVAKDLLGRSQAVSDECKSKTMELIVEGKTEKEILRSITEFEPENDAGNTQQRNTNGTPEGGKSDVSFKNIDDDEFIRSIAAPSMTLQ